MDRPRIAPPLRSRRAVLRLLPAAALLALACDQGNATDESSEPTRQLRALLPDRAPPDDTRPVSALQRTPTLRLPARPVLQGGAFLVALEGGEIAAASVEFAGRTTPLLAEGEGWLAVLGIGRPVGEDEQLPPGAYPLRVRAQSASGGADLLDGVVIGALAGFPVEALEFTPGVAALLDPALIEQEARVLRQVYNGFSGPRRWNGFFRRPSPAQLTDVYGSRRSTNGGPVSGSHSGVDFGADTGDPAFAAAPGRVALARPLTVRGNMVILDHGAGVFTGYCHLSAFNVTEGDDVPAGFRVGSVGATGLVTGPHLHWEVVAGGMHLDGLRWL